MTDAIEMSLTCGNCGTRIRNDMVDVQHPLDFIKACEERGWSAPHNPPRPPVCPGCRAKAKL